MLDNLANQSALFHAVFGIASILIGILFLRVSRAWRLGTLPDPLPPILRFMKGEGMPTLVMLAGWLALLGGIAILSSAVVLAFG